MPYLYFISTKLDSKSSQIEGLDVTFQMHSIAKYFDIVKYLKNKKNQKLKKNAANGLAKGFLSNEYSPPKKNLI